MCGARTQHFDRQARRAVDIVVALQAEPTLAVEREVGEEHVAGAQAYGYDLAKHHAEIEPLDVDAEQ